MIHMITDTPIRITVGMMSIYDAISYIARTLTIEWTIVDPRVHMVDAIGMIPPVDLTHHVDRLETFTTTVVLTDVIEPMTTESIREPATTLPDEMISIGEQIVDCTIGMITYAVTHAHDMIIVPRRTSDLIESPPIDVTGAPTRPSLMMITATTYAMIESADVKTTVPAY